MKDIQIKPITEVNDDEATTLLRLGMGDGSGEKRDPKFWRWKHRDNPSETSLGLAAYAPSGDLIALHPCMRWKLSSSSISPVTAVRGVDAVVHPSWRRKRIFSLLRIATLEQLKEYGIALTFETTNDKTAASLRKLGWRMLGHPYLLVHPRLPLKKFLVKLKGTRNDFDSILPCSWPSAGLALDKLSRLVGTCTRSGKLHVIKDTAFLRWRYAEHPLYDYRMVEVVTDEDHMVGAGIVRVDERRGHRGIAVAELFTDPGSPWAYEAVLERILTEGAGDYIVIGAPINRKETGTLLLKRFLPFPWINVNFAVRRLDPALEPPPDRSLSQWSLSLGDLEIF